MKLLFVFLLMLVSTKLLAQNLPHFSTTSVHKAQGYMAEIPSESYLRLTNYSQNWDKWYHEVFFVNKNNKKISSSTLKVSKEFLNKDIINQVHRELEFYDISTGRTVKIPRGQKYIITDSSDENWNSYSVQFYNSKNEPVDHDGKVVASYKPYLITRLYLDNDLLKTPLTAIEKLNAILNNPNSNIQCKDTSSSEAETKTTKKKSSPLATVTKADLNKKSIYRYLMDNRDSLLKNGYQSCVNKKKNIEDQFLASHPYGKLSLGQRADQILNSAKNVLTDIKKNTGNKKVSSAYKNFVNGNYIDPVVSPEVAACISYQETKGHLHPYVVNYTYCHKKMTSSAHGLSQVTRTTMNGMAKNPDGDLLPYNSTYSKKYKGKSTTQVHRDMSGDIEMQLEVLMRILSSNAKHIRWRYGSLSEKEILKKAVMQYDRDDQSKYIQNVINNCLPCFNSGKKGNKCYQTLK